jgi:molybdopterin-containing oxidoreductase family molybdopterin binding subunit
MAMSVKGNPEIKEDVWIKSTCGGCYGTCTIRAHRVNGVLVKIEGEPDNDFGARGGLCAKGEAMIQALYDPNRINYPLRRTNPEKGIFADPKWERISWDEALDEMAERLKKIRQENPNKLLHGGTPGPGSGPDLPLGFGVFGAVFGTKNWYIGGAGLHCGSGSHMGAGLYHASWSIVPDWKYCNYVIQMGSNKGTGSGHSMGFNMRLSADARARGAKIVVFDPICNFGGGKATEWIPLLPGSDGIIALAMVNILLNELKVYDAEFLKKKTNGPYLIGPDQLYVRDKETNKPLVWDAKANQAKVFNDPSIGDYALEGSYEVNGVKCQPAFQLLREHVKQYTPEAAEKESTVPAKTIRRIAREFGEAASVGTTIEIEGEKLPLRPVASIMFRGGQGHSNSAQSYIAMCLLNAIVGAMDVPGGTLGWPAYVGGYPETGRFKVIPYPCKDGMLTAGTFMEHGPWPVHESKVPGDFTMKELVPTASFSPQPVTSDFDKYWDTLGRPYEIEMAIIFGANMVRSSQSREIAEKFWKKVPFTVSFNILPNEFMEGFADIVLPDCHPLETYCLFSSHAPFFNHPIGMEGWCFPIRQPAVPPKYERRNKVEALWDLADRIGMREEMNKYYNVYFSSFGGEALISGDLASVRGVNAIDPKKVAQLIKPDEKITYAEMMDRAFKYYFGPEHGLKYMSEHGSVEWKKNVKEAYWRWYVDVRVPIYLEHLAELKPTIMANAKKAGVELQWEQYTPLPSYFKPQVAKEETPEYDLYSFSYRDILHNGTYTMEIPWLDEVSRLNPYTYNITMNADTAKKKGLKDGVLICLESSRGRKITGTLKTMQGQHPKTVAIAACSGAWARGAPIAYGKGTNFNTLLESDFEHACPVCWSQETATMVKVYKIDHRIEYDGARR